jgi:hypothetical protein
MTLLGDIYKPYNTQLILILREDQNYFMPVFAAHNAGVEARL